MKLLPDNLRSEGLSDHSSLQAHEHTHDPENDPLSSIVPPYVQLLDTPDTNKWAVVAQEVEWVVH